MNKNQVVFFQYGQMKTLLRYTINRFIMYYEQSEGATATALKSAINDAMINSEGYFSPPGAMDPDLVKWYLQVILDRAEELDAETDTPYEGCLTVAISQVLLTGGGILQQRIGAMIKADKMPAPEARPADPIENAYLLRFEQRNPTEGDTHNTRWAVGYLAESGQYFWGYQENPEYWRITHYIRCDQIALPPVLEVAPAEED